MPIKLHENQIVLLRHLARYLTLDYPSCLHVLDTDKRGDRKSLSYAFRPLTKHGYVSKHKDGSVNILAKGRALFPDITPLVTLGGSGGAIRRANEISRMALLMEEHGFPSAADPDESDIACFVPSTCWRKIRQGILSTTRFLGILFIGEHRLAVYDIDNGKMDWQLRAERSLFYTKYGQGQFDTAATGMLWLCDDAQRIEVAKNIIRHTMWRRRQLIRNAHEDRREKPVSYSHAPIRITPQYGHVYLTTPALLDRDTSLIAQEADIIKKYKKNAVKCFEVCTGDYEVAATEEEDACRFYINPATDLLKYIYFFSTLKDYKGILENPEIPYVYPMQYAMVLPKRDIEIAKMYPYIAEMEAAAFYEYTN